MNIFKWINAWQLWMLRLCPDIYPEHFLQLINSQEIYTTFTIKKFTHLYRGIPFLAAPALHTAKDTPRMALAPNLDLFSVPSNFSIS